MSRRKRLSDLSKKLSTIPDPNMLEKSPEWIALRTLILDTLLPYKDARDAILAALNKAEEHMSAKDAVSPAVQRLIDETLSTDPPAPQPDRRPQSVVSAEVKPLHQPASAERRPAEERRKVARIKYRCIAPTFWMGMHWAVGQVIDGSRPELYPPPLGCWEPFTNSMECPRAPMGPLQGTRRPG